MGALALLLRCAPVATWCLVILGAATLFLGRLDNRFDGIDARLDRMGRRQEEAVQQLRGDVNSRFEEVNRRFDRLEALLMESSGQ